MNLFSGIGINYNEKENGFESEFHFIKVEESIFDDLIHTKKILQHELTPICSYCKKIRNNHDEWIKFDDYFDDEEKLEMTHGVCPECTKQMTKNLHNHMSLA